jgi:hypothetical protein
MTLNRGMLGGKALQIHAPVVVEVPVLQGSVAHQVYVEGQVEQASPMTLRPQAQTSTMLVAAAVMG